MNPTFPSDGRCSNFDKVGKNSNQVGFWNATSNNTLAPAICSSLWEDF